MTAFLGKKRWKMRRSERVSGIITLKRKERIIEKPIFFAQCPADRLANEPFRDYLMIQVGRVINYFG